MKNSVCINCNLSFSLLIFLIRTPIHFWVDSKVRKGGGEKETLLHNYQYSFLKSLVFETFLKIHLNGTHNLLSFKIMIHSIWFGPGSSRAFISQGRNKLAGAAGRRWGFSKGWRWSYVGSDAFEQMSMVFFWTRHGRETLHFYHCLLVPEPTLGILLVCSLCSLRAWLMLFLGYHCSRSNQRQVGSSPSFSHNQGSPHILWSCI